MHKEQLLMWLDEEVEPWQGTGRIRRKEESFPGDIIHGIPGRITFLPTSGPLGWALPANLGTWPVGVYFLCTN